MDSKDYYWRLKWGLVASLFAAVMVTTTASFLVVNIVNSAGGHIVWGDILKLNIMGVAFVGVYIIFFSLVWLYAYSTYRRNSRHH